MNGTIRFALFVAVIAAIGLGVYANSLQGKLAQKDAAIASLTTDRDSWHTKSEAADKKAADAATALQQEQTKSHDLETQLEAAKTKPPARRR
jgi:peptidoglycan hydrolase CwlO-like protein